MHSMSHKRTCFLGQNAQPADGFHPSLHVMDAHESSICKWTKNETTWHLPNPNEINECTKSGRVRSGGEGEGRQRAYLAGRQRWFLDGRLAQGSTQAWIQEAGWSGDGRGGIELSRQRWKKTKRLSFRLCISPVQSVSLHTWSPAIQ